MRLLPALLKPAGLALAGGALAAFLGCAGSGSTTPAAPATAFAYVPATGTGYQLVRNGASTATHLVLDLTGPQGAQIKGVVVTLTTDTSKAAWGKAGGTDAYLLPGQVLNLGSGTPLLKSLLTGTSLQAALFQKGATPAATLSTQAILSVALDLKPGTLPGAITLAAPSAQVLNAAGQTVSVPVAVGTLAAQ